MGCWLNGLRNGRGKQYCFDGSFYDGYWLNNKIHGKGRLIHPDGEYYVQLSPHKYFRKVIGLRIGKMEKGYSSI